MEVAHPIYKSNSIQKNNLETIKATSVFVVPEKVEGIKKDIESVINFEEILLKKGYVKAPLVNINSTTLSSKKVGANMATFSTFLLEPFQMAKEQIKYDMISDIKLVTALSFLLSALAGAFGVPFWFILVVFLGAALFELFLSMIKRFRLPGVDYNPIAKLQVFGGAVIVFSAFSFIQIFGQFAIWQLQGSDVFKTAPSWLRFLEEISVFQLIGAMFILSFYINSIRKMFMYGANGDAKTNEHNQANATEAQSNI